MSDTNLNLAELAERISPYFTFFFLFSFNEVWAAPSGRDLASRMHYLAFFFFLFVLFGRICPKLRSLISQGSFGHDLLLFILDV
jgi:hypothetical protein